MRPPGRRTAMCGIFGYVGHAQNAADLVLRGLKKLEYRGYDSWGVAVGHADQVVLAKQTGKIGDAAPDLPASAIGIGHTRWATHGGVTEPNAHPHLDCAGRLALIHNGIVSNYRELREPLVRSGHRFRSETDTEVVAHLIEECLAATPAGPEQLVSATMTAFRRLHGLNAIAVADVRTGQIAAAMIRDAADVFVVGCGTAGHAALAAQYLLARIAGRRVTVATGSEFPYLMDFVREGALVIALSQSGETIDVIDAVRAARQRGARLAAIVNVEGSTLWRLADLTVPLGAGPERCVLATKSFTAKLAMLLLTAYELAGRAAAGPALVAHAAGEIERLLADDRRDLIRQVAEAIDTREHLFVIGRGPSYPLALEAALKVKEVSYIHAEGFAGGDLKHGVIALIEPGTPCLVLAPRDETYDDIMAGAMQVKARGAMLIGVSPEPHEAFDYHIPVADLGPATAILN